MGLDSQKAPNPSQDNVRSSSRPLTWWWPDTFGSVVWTPEDQNSWILYCQHYPVQNCFFNHWKNIDWERDELDSLFSRVWQELCRLTLRMRDSILIGKQNSTNWPTKSNHLPASRHPNSSKLIPTGSILFRNHESNRIWVDTNGD